jgi:hypothetical protein
LNIIAITGIQFYRSRSAGSRANRKKTSSGHVHNSSAGISNYYTDGQGFSLHERIGHKVPFGSSNDLQMAHESKCTEQVRRVLGQVPVEDAATWDDKYENILATDIFMSASYAAVDA